MNDHKVCFPELCLSVAYVLGMIRWGWCVFQTKIYLQQYHLKTDKPLARSPYSISLSLYSISLSLYTVNMCISINISCVW